MLTEAYQDDSEANLFLGLQKEEIWEQVHKWWDVKNYSIPIPKKVLTCPQCDSKQLQVRSVPWHKTNSKTIPYRADFNLKCSNCALRYGHGVVIPESMYEDLEANAFGNRWIQQLALMHKRNEVSSDWLGEHLHNRVHTIWNGHH